jgi:hypothetical protein
MGVSGHRIRAHHRLGRRHPRADLWPDLPICSAVATQTTLFSGSSRLQVAVAHMLDFQLLLTSTLTVGDTS